jgi:N-acetyl-1-D-myo-inositol-2-amino-2-deoxy-alpha-D-glucopyranoside deacetylase
LETWLDRWGNRQPLRAILSNRNAVPYDFAYRPGAPFKGEEILKDLESIIRDFNPTKIFTSHPGDVHPDHQALSLFLKVALLDLSKEIQPRLYNFMTHYGKWPQPLGLQPDLPEKPPAKFDIKDRWTTQALTADQIQLKLEALKEHKTQFGSGGNFLQSFIRRTEVFDSIPEISLDPTTKSAFLLQSGAGIPDQPSMLLTESQQATFNDIDIKNVRVDGNELVFSVDFLQPLKGEVKSSAHLMGYRFDTQFAEMPKLSIEFSNEGYKLYDQDRRLPNDTIKVSHTPLSNEVRVPLDILGNPQRLFLSAKTKIKNVPLDTVPWVVINLEGSKK